MIGIDVSHWNGDLDWGLLYPSIGFALMKCTQGITYFDDKYARNKEGCVKYGIPHGVYHYFEPDIDGDRQAEYFFKKAADPTLLVWVLDVEKQSAISTENHNLNLEKAVKRLREFTGEQPWIYTSKYKWNICTGDLIADWAQRCQLWVANYTTASAPILPAGWGTWGMWQYSEDGEVAGVYPLDVNRYNGTAEEMQLDFGNGSIPPEPQRVDKVRVVYQGGLNIRSAPVVATSTLIGGAYYGSIWGVLGRVTDSLGRTWIQIGTQAFIAGWYTEDV